MRHAKSDWSGDHASDHDRPLNDRGIGDAPVMARWIAESGFLPDFVLCSSAKRTQQTALLMNSFWQHSGLPVPSLAIVADLYLCSATTVFATVRQQASLCHESGRERPQNVLVLAHNPGISRAASILAGVSIELPTAALAVLRCSSADWSADLTPEVMRCVAEMKPKKLKGESR